MPSGLPPPVSALVRRLVAAGLLVFFGLGCDSTGPEDTADAPPPRPLTAAEDQVVDADNAFGLTLPRSTVDTEGASKNVFLSPISVSMALGMTLNGARGETRSAMEAALEKQDLSPTDINDAYRGLIDLLEGLDPNVEVALPTPSGTAKASRSGTPSSTRIGHTSTPRWKTSTLPTRPRPIGSTGG
ncbi:serpin family protein [Salinibacter ruber]|uniref:serpin family protein n=1 Tax=Salinibacter ruber TaxID=146919 RepID=UPI00216A99FB|nr:serpin family protein [Salinibacter ruber]MCS3704863.1 hypothetical protein [Salinibacter ruber]